MGENVKVREGTSADEIREQIRHTEGDITKTVYRLEERFTPSYVKRRGVKRAKQFAWQGIAKALELVQRTSVQAMLVGGSAALIVFGNRRLRERIAAKAGAKKGHPIRTGALLLLLRGLGTARKAERGWLGMAVTAAKAFISGKRASGKRGTSAEGRKLAWRGLATSIGAALGSFRYSHKLRRFGGAR